MFRIGASLIVIVVLAVSWFVFGDHSSGNPPSTESAPASQPSADDDALRRSLGGK